MSRRPEKAGLPGSQTLPHRQASGAISDNDAVPDVDLSDVCLPLSAYTQLRTAYRNE